CCCNPDQRIQRPDVRNGLLIQYNSARLHKDCSLHFRHWTLLSPFDDISMAIQHFATMSVRLPEEAVGPAFPPGTFRRIYECTRAAVASVWLSLTGGEPCRKSSPPPISR